MEGGDGEHGSAPKKEDDVLREQSFKRPTGLNLDSFMLSSSPDEKTSAVDEDDALQPSSKTADAAVGNVRDLFTMEVSEEQTTDSTTQLAVHGEQTIGKGLAVAMVVVWTAIGALVGTVLPPVLGGLGLFAMAAFGLYLGERWIRRDSMHLLGITWVMISMNLLYGLALDAWRWGWLADFGLPESQVLGGLMLGLVGVNVGLAFRHDEDAIAAQSALVLFAIGSSAGAVSYTHLTLPTKA